jgi:tight adherence protein B
VAAVLDHVVQSVRADQELAREVRTECASARATARLLAVLPLLGLGLGSGLGGDPVQVLTRTLPGAVCLAAGTALALAGLAWVDAITARAVRGAT